ncbi:uncharacterized protein BJ171DRAFT_303795 [Polychytrium aggregatum]|uniref:uncharacterized protein n=1 Tax=Polychytrium aggregatum TaxID=110093 RepID=UPI0022FE3815|nr:uncharacterized protein BJ171DRAFT_303795 [Polychytrium aggregatum]KAI9193163.1 hypothetical protein BJ171DRAFT_303795 [Polychytrium aggregatum]
MSRFKLPPKGKKATKPEEAAPLSFDDIVDEAINMEEKGDRYVDGDKARRFYERSCELYAQAVAMNPEHDPLYNRGRLLLLLAEFRNPPYRPSECRGLLESSVNCLRRAAELEPTNTDTLFNLAQALRTSAEHLFSIDGQEPLAIAVAEEACALLEKVFALQSEAYQRNPVDSAGSEPQPGVSTQQLPQDGDKIEESLESVTAIQSVTKDTLIDTLVAWAETLSLRSSFCSDYASCMHFHSVAMEKLKLSEALGIEPARLSLRCADALSTLADTLASNEVEPTTAAEYFKQSLALVQRALEIEPSSVEALCDKGDILWSFLAFQIKYGGSEAEIRTAFADVVNSYTSAFQLESQNAEICAKLGDAQLYRILLYPSPEQQKTREVLVGNAILYYKRALAISETRIDAIRTCLHMGKAASQIPERDMECREAMIMWKKKGGKLVNGIFSGTDEDIPVDFSPATKASPWFQQLLVILQSV